MFCEQNEKGMKFNMESDLSSKCIRKNKANYKNPPIPEGYHYVVGSWNDGFVISRNFDKSQFVWIPVGCLEPNGTIDGIGFKERFGRRNFHNEDHFCFRYTEQSQELEEQIESVQQYGGFYISRFVMSRYNRGEIVSCRGNCPLVFQSETFALHSAKCFENRENLSSHLVYGAEFDSMLEFIMFSKSKSYYEVVCDSTSWGNYVVASTGTEDASALNFSVCNTGSSEMWCANRIYDVAGNICEFTQERNVFSSSPIFRGGVWNLTNVAARDVVGIGARGFRVALSIK